MFHFAGSVSASRTVEPAARRVEQDPVVIALGDRLRPGLRLDHRQRQDLQRKLRLRLHLLELAFDPGLLFEGLGLGLDRTPIPPARALPPHRHAVGQCRLDSQRLGRPPCGRAGIAEHRLQGQGREDHRGNSGRADAGEEAAPRQSGQRARQSAGTAATATACGLMSVGISRFHGFDRFSSENTRSQAGVSTAAALGKSSLPGRGAEGWCSMLPGSSFRQRGQGPEEEPAGAGGIVADREGFAAQRVALGE